MPCTCGSTKVGSDVHSDWCDLVVAPPSTPAPDWRDYVPIYYTLNPDGSLTPSVANIP